MKSHAKRWVLVTGLMMTGCTTCDDATAPSAEAPSPSTTESNAPRSSALADIPLPTAEQLPLPQDYAAYAQEHVTAENYRAELDAIAEALGEAGAEQATGESLPSPGGQRRGAPRQR